MAYIWINPVTASMYQPNELEKYLKKHGYQRFDVETDWLLIVKNKYNDMIKNSKHTVFDCRCPKVKEMLENEKLGQEVIIPDIAPILIHCGIEGSERVELLNEDKIITTPCQALADMGNELQLPHTWFMTWNAFTELMGSELKGIVPEKSPIPPGFFDELKIKIDSVTGEEEIRTYLKNFVPGQAELVELLYCKEGCHNGDGIRKCRK